MSSNDLKVTSQNNDKDVFLKKNPKTNLERVIQMVLTIVKEEIL